MGDQLTDLLRERFTGHEMNVPPGAWEQVSGQLAANASGESLRETMQDKFNGHEADVDPSAWTNISGQLMQGTVPGASFSTGWITAGVAAVAITAGVFLWNHNKAGPDVPAVERTHVAVVASPATTNEPVSVNPAPVPETPEKRKELVQPTPEKAVVPTAPVKSGSVEAVETTPEPKAVERSEPATPKASSSTADQETPVVKPAAPSEAPIPKQETTPVEGPATHGTDMEMPKVTEGASKEEATVAPPPGSTNNERSEEDPFRNEHASTVLIPNVFSPQEDGVNDVLKIVARDYEKVDVRVFTAKGGALVFRSNDLANMWDGRLPNGNIAEEGYYRCVVLLTDKEGRTRMESEVVRLFR
ncbi:MAG: gliding motility-associated C-terminal domain-containing protein [Flavobacteriales bacterium]|jgi:hypothetical protein|nr:gliding motility-associated C-terminal domain-containing protein [Flavobacteriales bacterium]